MSDQLTEAIEEAYASAPEGEVILHTLEFAHPSFTNPIRVVLDAKDFQGRLEADAPNDPDGFVTFIRFAFELQLPETQSNSLPELVIRLDNVSYEIEDAMAQAVASPHKITVIYRPYLESDPQTPQWDPPMILTIHHVEADDFTVTARASYGDSSNKSFPSELYTDTRFPGLIR